MASYDFVQALFQHGRVERTCEANSGWEIIGGVLRLKLVEKPQPLLRKGKGNQTLLRAPRNMERLFC